MKTLNRTLLFVIAVAIPFLLGSSLNAQLISQPFNSPLGGFPDDWNRTYSGGTAASTIEIQERSEGVNQLLLRRDNGGHQIIHYIGSQGDIVNGVMADFSVSVVLMAPNSRNDPRGIVGRTSNTNYSNISGYYAYVQSNNLYITKDPVSGNSHGTTLISAALSENLSVEVDYLHTFSAIGDQLSAAIWKMDGEGNFSILLGEVSVTDDSYSSGLVGIRVAPGGNGRITWVSDFEMTIIPEPLTISLTVAIAGFLLIRRFRRKAVA